MVPITVAIAIFFMPGPVTACVVEAALMGWTPSSRVAPLPNKVFLREYVRESIQIVHDLKYEVSVKSRRRTVASAPSA